MSTHSPLALIYPMAAHFVWTMVLYVALTFARLPSVWGIGKDRQGNNPWALYEKRISANLSNQFEWPLFFYVIALVAMFTPNLNLSYVSIAAWVFIAGRIVHSGVQIFTANIRLRGLVFMINFLAVVAMWAEVLVRIGNR